MLVSVTSRPHASLGRILEDLGPTLLDLICAADVPAHDIGGIVIYDPLDEPVLPYGALVLGVGVHEPAEIGRLLSELGARGAAGLVVRAPVSEQDVITEAVRTSGVTLLGLTRGASWAQLAAMLRSLIAEGDVSEDGAETLGGMPAGDLFALANAVSALLDAPITVEDRDSRVLAFSGRQDEADSSRVETILGRQVPERFTHMLEQRGVFQQIQRDDQPVYVEPLPNHDGEPMLPRVALAVRAGDEFLGSIWAAVREPLSEERNHALRDAAKLVALHMLRQRAGADVQRRLRADLVGTVLEGGPGAVEAARRLGITDQAAVVVALSVADPPEGEESAAAHTRLLAQRQRVADAFAMHLAAVHPRSAAALVGAVVYGVIPVPHDGRDGEDRASRVAAEFLERIGNGIRLFAGIGLLATDRAALARSRVEADRALRVLCDGNGSRTVARVADVHIEALLLELADRVADRGDPPIEPVARLIAYDTEHRTCLLDTLRAWLDAFGDVTSASTAMYVHPNTFRYRLRRLTEVGGIDLTDPQARFAAMLQLRLLSRQ